MADGITEYLCKVLVVGDSFTGKTSLIGRFVHNIFSNNYKTTIGVDFALKDIIWDDRTHIKLQLWDIAGQERFSNMTRVYYREAVGAFVVFDVTRSPTFEATERWKKDIDAKVWLPPDNAPIPVVLLANKVDLAPDGFVGHDEVMNKHCEMFGFIGWEATSAKMSGPNNNIDKATRYLLSKILERSGVLQYTERERAASGADGTIILGDSGSAKESQPKEKGCC
eukprot:TRINITY_DN10_c0_g2_i1.p1 TRINITY_DN10_c0_g2~~TRINITY_DN10_c0_g2_i1.p1  ORF type:complete len:224 (-),score=53.77 TRINITY_DN10_c0_g2_i1:75-746(-)